jgi:type I restriction enzyme, S subunit
VTGGGEITLTGSKYVPASAVTDNDKIKPDEVLFNNTNSSLWVGKSAVFDLESDCACSNHMTRLRFRNSDNSPIYLAAYLNALRSIGYFAALATNFNNQAGINSDALGSLRIPVPLPATQATIAAEVDRRRAEARRLRAKARAGWVAARQAFEDALLGPTI